MSKFIVYANPKFSVIAAEIFSESKVYRIKRDYFPGGQPNFLIPNISLITECKGGGANVLYFMQYESLQEKAEEQLIITTLADTLNVKTFTVVEPYDPSATMERVTEEGRIATANVDAHFWRNLPKLSSGQKTRRVVYDHHTLQNRFYFTDGTTENFFRSAMPYCAQWIQSQIDQKAYPKEDYAVAFPDDGAHKRFGKNFCLL